MWRSVPLLLVLYVAVGVVNAQEEVTEVKSKIDAVTVYLNGATVTRSVEVDVKAGKQTFAFGGCRES